MSDLTGSEVVDVAPSVDPAPTSPHPPAAVEGRDTPSATGAGSTTLKRRKVGRPRKPAAAKKVAAVRADVAPKGPGRPSQLDKLRGQLDEQLVTIGTVLAAVNEFDGMTIVHGAPKVSDALVRAAEQNPRVKAALESFLATSTWGAVLGALGVVVLPILANHGLAPANLKGLSPYAKAAGAGGGDPLAGAGIPAMGDVAAMFDALSPEEQAEVQAQAAAMFGGMFPAAGNGATAGVGS